MSLFPILSFSSDQCQCSFWLSKCCSNHINILYTTAFHATVQGAHKGNYQISAMTDVDWAGERNNKPSQYFRRGSVKIRLGFSRRSCLLTRCLILGLFNISLCHCEKTVASIVLTVWVVTCHFN